MKFYRVEELYNTAKKVEYHIVPESDLEEELICKTIDSLQALTKKRPETDLTSFMD